MSTIDDAVGQTAFREGELLEEQGNFKSAASLYRTAAVSGSALGQLALGNAYAAGRGVKRDRDEAARWYRMAYRNGLAAGAINLAVDLERKGNRRGAIAWLRRGAALKDGSACLRLAKLYLQNPRGRETAAELLEQVVAMSACQVSEEEKRDAESQLILLRT